MLISVYFIIYKYFEIWFSKLKMGIEVVRTIQQKPSYFRTQSNSIVLHQYILTSEVG